MTSIITVNYNETEMTCAMLESIRRQGIPDVQLIVVDNASRENPADLFKALFPEVTFIRSEQNLGFAGGNNLALPHAKGEFLFFVNNDAEPTPGCIETLLHFFAENPNAGIVSPLICYYPEEKNAPALIQYVGMTPVSPFTGRNRTLGAGKTDQGQFDRPARTAYAHGAAMMVPRKVLETAGPMWEGFFLYYEELDWCERILKAGFEVWVEPRARVWHKESHTLDKMGPTKTYYLTRNRLLFMRRNFGGWRRGVFLAFLYGITLPANIIRYALRKDWVNLRAFLRGISGG